MALSFSDRWLWDFWLATDGPDYHLFFLQAPRALGDPELRHWNVSIGHAVSQDLRRWEVLPDALAPEAEPAWDDYTTWTGSVVRHAGRWWMFYTGTSRREDGRIQRVGMATSHDLITWERYGKPVLEADPAWYELLDPAVWYEQAWRDPWVFRDDSGAFHCLITARARSGDPDTRGVIGHATSEDLLDWTVRPPVTAPGVFGHLEVPQVERMGGAWRLLFSAPAAPRRVWEQHPPARRPGTHVLSSDRPLGPYDWGTHQALDAAPHDGVLYGGRLVRQGADWQLLSWIERGPGGTFTGVLTDPVPVAVVDGRIAVRADLSQRIAGGEAAQRPGRPAPRRPRP